MSNTGLKHNFRGWTSMEYYRSVVIECNKHVVIDIVEEQLLSV